MNRRSLLLGGSASLIAIQSNAQSFQFFGGGSGAVAGSLRLSGILAFSGFPYYAQIINGYAAGSTFTAAASDGTALTVTTVSVTQLYPLIIGTFSSNGAKTISITEYPTSGPPSVSTVAINVVSPPAAAVRADVLAAATKVINTYNARQSPIPVSLTPPTISIGANNVPSTINGRSVADGGIVSNGSIADGYSGPLGTSATWFYAQTVTGVLQYAQCSSKRFAFGPNGGVGGQKFDFKLNYSIFGSPGCPQFRIRYSEDAGATWAWASANSISANLNAGAGYVLVDFGTAANRIIELIGSSEGFAMYGFNFDGGTVGTTSAVAGQPRMAMWNDSYVFGEGTPDPTMALVRTAADTNGVLDIINVGLRTNAWSRDGGTQGTQPFVQDRLYGDPYGYNGVTAYGPLDVVILCASINDFTAVPQHLYDQAVTAFQRARYGQPNALIVFILGMHPPDDIGTPSTWINAFNAALGSDVGAYMLNGDAVPWVPAGAVGSSPYFPSLTVVVSGSVAGNILTVSSITSGGPIEPGMSLNVSGGTVESMVGPQISGTTGGVGTYELTMSQPSLSGSFTLTGDTLHPQLAGHTFFGAQIAGAIMSLANSI